MSSWLNLGRSGASNFNLSKKIGNSLRRRELRSVVRAWSFCADTWAKPAHCLTVEAGPLAEVGSGWRS
jgi:hypothetical protein